MAEYGHFLTQDPSEFELALRPWDVMIEPRDRGNQWFELEYLSMPGLLAYREHYEGNVGLVGMPPPGRLAIAMPEGDPDNSTIYDSSIVGQQLYSLNEDVLETRYERGYSHLVVEIDLEHQFDENLALSLENLTSKRRNLTFSRSPDRASQLRRAVLRALRAGSSGRAEDHPRNMHAIRSEIEGALSHAVLLDAVDIVDGKTTAPIAAVSRMLEYLRTPGVECASVSELCACTGINQRALERGARTRFDCTAVQFLRKWRLHAARQRLVATGRDESTVSDIAMSLGFFDLGRFASAYRHYFGEYPSETLVASSRSSAPLLFGM